jgi:hypothetical protein
MHTNIIEERLNIFSDQSSFQMNLDYSPWFVK